jgi:hypothetical protein
VKLEAPCSCVCKKPDAAKPQAAQARADGSHRPPGKHHPTNTPSTGEHSSQPIRCFFQEPVYHDVDIAFLEGLSPLHTVVATPDAYQHVTPSTLLFGIHLYRSVTRDAMAASIPGIFVGTDWWLYER